MPDDGPPDDSRPGESNDNHSESSDSEPTHWLSSLLSFLDSLDQPSKPSRSAGGHGDGLGLDYDVSVRSGLGSAATNPDRRSTHGDTADDRSVDSTERSSRDRSVRRRRRSPTSSHHVTTRTYEDELLVTTDVSGIDVDAINAGFDTDGRTNAQLVVAIRSRELERVDVPWPLSSVDANASINNDILTVTVTEVTPAELESVTGSERSTESEGTGGPTESEGTGGSTESESPGGSTESEGAGGTNEDHESGGERGE